MNRLTLLDALFLGVETQELPAHVAGLQIFELPRGKGSAWLHSLMDELRQRPPGSPFNEKLHSRFAGLRIPTANPALNRPRPSEELPC